MLTNGERILPVQFGETFFVHTSDKQDISYVEIPKVAMVNEGNLCVSINKSFTESIKCKEPVSLVCTLSL